MFMIVLAHYAYHGGVMFHGSIPNQIVGPFAQGVRCK